MKFTNKNIYSYCIERTFVFTLNFLHFHINTRYFTPFPLHQQLYSYNKTTFQEPTCITMGVAWVWSGAVVGESAVFDILNHTTSLSALWMQCEWEFQAQTCWWYSWGVLLLAEINVVMIAFVDWSWHIREDDILSNLFRISACYRFKEICPDIHIYIYIYI